VTIFHCRFLDSSTDTYGLSTLAVHGSTLASTVTEILQTPELQGVGGHVGGEVSPRALIATQTMQHIIANAKFRDVIFLPSSLLFSPPTTLQCGNSESSGNSPCELHKLDKPLAAMTWMQRLKLWENLTGTRIESEKKRVRRMR